MGVYDEKLWDTATAKYGCAWDTGRAAVLQQPVKNDNGVLRGTGARVEIVEALERVAAQTLRVLAVTSR